MEHLPLIGDRFPTLEVQTTHGPKTLPDDYEGQWFVLFSHPADFTPVCTTEFVGFQKRVPEFEKLGCSLIGLSIDQVFGHIQWVRWIKEHLDVEITFPIIADDGNVARHLGMLHPKKGTNTVRAVFVVDPESTVRLLLYYPQEAGRNMDEIVRVVKALQVSDANDVAMPANWPNNELIGDSVIIPPASDANAAEEAVHTYDNYDWWFCHKKLQ